MKFAKINFRKMWAYYWQDVQLNLASIKAMTDGDGDVLEHNKDDIINQIEAIKGHLTKLQNYVEEQKKQPRPD